MQKLEKKGQEVYINRERGIMVINVLQSPISERKRDTALYKATKGSDFSKMSIDNNFSTDNVGRIKSKPLKEYRPIVSVGELCIYEHKSNRSIYATTHRVGDPPKYGKGDAEKARFIRDYRWLWDEYMDNNIEFEEYVCEILFTKAYKLYIILCMDGGLAHSQRPEDGAEPREGYD